jgi:hypothetical protein
MGDITPEQLVRLRKLKQFSLVRVVIGSRVSRVCRLEHNLMYNT